MEVTHSIEGKSCIFYLEGDLAESGTSVCKEYMIPFLGDPSFQKIIFNFKGVRFVSSSGIGLLIGVFKSLQKRKATLILCDLVPDVQRVLALGGMDRIMKILGTEKEALDH